jgi:hypothetical protein
MGGRGCAVHVVVDFHDVKALPRSRVWRTEVFSHAQDQPRVGVMRAVPCLKPWGLRQQSAQCPPVVALALA